MPQYLIRVSNLIITAATEEEAAAKAAATGLTSFSTTLMEDEVVYKNVWVDVPPPKPSPGTPWNTVGNFTTKKDALAFIRANIGPCDEQGNVRLINLGERADGKKDSHPAK